MSRAVTCGHPERAYHARGLCRPCYARASRTGTLPDSDWAYPECATAGCKGHLSAPGRDVCMACLLARLGITYRQLDFWSTRGWLRPAGGNGSGYQREWPDSELEVAARMARLVSAGLPVPAAAEFARESWPKGEIAPGVVLEVTG